MIEVLNASATVIVNSNRASESQGRINTRYGVGRRTRPELKIGPGSHRLAILQVLVLLLLRFFSLQGYFCGRLACWSKNCHKLTSWSPRPSRSLTFLSFAPLFLVQAFHSQDSHACRRHCYRSNKHSPSTFTSFYRTQH